ncbi:dihydrofolate reductase [Ornithinimicrobium cerasi]|uniref:dihydrofolate reductase n=1 Tax=Ornithinimicrobium cerasi TaxID=2248773 RepID=A0A285VNF3_9MICO|nr:dihydrofolate reductase [Ornithinimicrobium cerasi]SOC55437.1 Dihydrofolate reductase [Ornithinimicrobium cerasi]
MTSRFQVVPAAYVALLRDGPDGVEVLLQLRSGTGYMDGRWAHGAAGHVELGESALAAAAREAAEELGVGVDPADLGHVATVHRTVAVHRPSEERVDLFVSTRRWSGEPSPLEPGKVAELRWWPLTALPDDVVPHERAALDVLVRREVPGAAAGDAGPTLLTLGFDQRLTLVAAVGTNGVIGDGARMPWHLPEDLRFFRRTTTGGTLLMGRGTWDSIGRALPGRRTIVITRQRSWAAPGAEVAHSLEEALALAGDGEVFVVGGGEVYAQTIDHASRLLVTEVGLAPPGGTRFPEIDPRVWREVARVPGSGDVLGWVTWERSAAGMGGWPTRSDADHSTGA